MDKGLLFYYDWLVPLSRLTDEEFRLVVCTMVNYHQSEFELPVLDGLAGIALDFIIPQINRMKENAKNGKKGGRPKKEETDVSNIINKEEDLPPSSSPQASEWDELISRASKKGATLRKERAERTNKRCAEQ